MRLSNLPPGVTDAMIERQCNGDGTMIHLRLQRGIRRAWTDTGKPEDAGHDADDAEEMALHWLAEIYCGSYPVEWPGPYRIVVRGDDMLPLVVTMDHPKFAQFCEDESEAESERAKDSSYAMRD